MKTFSNTFREILEIVRKQQTNFNNFLSLSLRVVLPIQLMPQPLRKFTKNYTYSSKQYVEPLGPSTSLIKPIEFINASKSTLENSRIALEQMKARLDSLDDETRFSLESRCR